MKHWKISISGSEIWRCEAYYIFCNACILNTVLRSKEDRYNEEGKKVQNNISEMKPKEFVGQIIGGSIKV